MKWTKELHKFNSHFKNTSFLCPRELFMDELKTAGPFLNGAIKHLGHDFLKINTEIAYQDFPFLKKFKDSKILIIGAGPSLENNFNSDDYDYIWTCNHFYKNEKIKNLPISLITLGNENNLNDRELIEFLSKNKTIICFENKYTKTEEMRFYKQKFEDRVFWAFTRYHSRIGSIPRLATIAVFLGAKQIDFIGMDGHYLKSLRDKYGVSAFEKDKKPSGTIEESGINDNEILTLYKEQYLVFWDYLLHDIGKEIIFKNLGHNHPCNISSFVLKHALGDNYEEYLFKSRKNV